jgi:lycopene beta-cyclase
MTCRCIWHWRRRIKLMAEVADLVILGGGLAGLSLAMRLAQAGFDGSVRVIEPREHYVDDRSWAFWMSSDALASVPVTRSWERWLFSRQDGDPVPHCAEGWRYAYVRGIDFYRAALSAIATRPNITLLPGAYARVMKHTRTGVEVSTNQGILVARHVVDTRPPSAPQWAGVSMFQCFAGREVLLDAPGIDDRQVELMTDMRSDGDGFVFSYVLPLSKTQALVEATRFSRRPLGADALSRDLDALLETRGWSGAQVLRSEAAVLPMGLPAPAEPTLPRVVRAGTAAGALRAASGYGFLRIQAWAERCAQALMQGQPPLGHPAEPRLRQWMDGVFLRALARHPDRSPEFFLRLAASVKAAAFLRFMSDQAGWLDHCRIIAALPPGPFLRALRSQPLGSGVPA